MPQGSLPPTTDAEIRTAADSGLYSPAHEHDACGVGFVAHIKGQKAHAIVAQGLSILANLDHRGAVGADKLMGDGAGAYPADPAPFNHPTKIAVLRVRRKDRRKAT